MGARRGAAVHAPVDRVDQIRLLLWSHVARRLGRHRRRRLGGAAPAPAPAPAGQLLSLGRDQAEEHLVSFLRMLFLRIRRPRISIQPLVRCSGGIPFCLELPIPLAHFVCELLQLKGREGG